MIEASRASRLDPQDRSAQIRAAHEAQRSIPIVRRSPEFSWGECYKLGTYVRETKASIFYKTSSGELKSVRKVTKTRSAGSRGTQVAHLEICAFCSESRKPNSCMHGRVGFCESCASA